VTQPVIASTDTSNDGGRYRQVEEVEKVEKVEEVEVKK